MAKHMQPVWAQGPENEKVLSLKILTIVSPFQREAEEREVSSLNIAKTIYKFAPTISTCSHQHVRHLYLHMTCQCDAHRIPKKFMDRFFILWSFHYLKSGSLSLSPGKTFPKEFRKAKERESDRWSHAVGMVDSPLQISKFW